MAYGSPSTQRLYYAMPWPLQEAMASAAGFQHRRHSRGRFFARWLEHLKDAQFSSWDEQRRTAWRRLQSTLDLACRESPFYRRLFTQTGMRPEDIRHPKDLAMLPLLTKEEVRQHEGEILTGAYPRGNGARAVHTSGTTGKALSIWLSQECYEREYAYRALHYSWAGVSLDDRCAVFAGHPVVHVDHQSPPFWRHDWAGNRLLFSSQHLFPKFAAAYVKALEQFEPVVIHGYPSVVAWMAAAVMQFAQDRIRPKAVFTASETLLPQQRALIEGAFRCKVYNWYGNGEHIACITECPLGSLHIQTEHSWLEFLDDTGTPVPSGVPGRLVATTLCNRAMPLVRYVVGDVITPSGQTCPCGRRGPLVQSIEGRVEDYIVGAEGQLFGRLDHIFKDSKTVAEAQIVQDTPGKATIRLVRRPEYTDHDTEQLLAAARFRLGRQFQISFEMVDSIPRSSNGKFEFIRSSCHQSKTRIGVAS
jgi:phenylacetate-CoA ligase